LEEQKFYSVSDAARMLSVNPVTIRRMIKSGKLFAVKPFGLNGHYRISYSALAPLINQKKEGE
jgi:excisionase family DNA binding protein